MYFIASIATVCIYLYGIAKLKQLIKRAPLSKKKSPEFKYTFWLILIYGLITVVIIMLLGSFIGNQVIKYYLITYSEVPITSNLVYDSIKESLHTVSRVIKSNPSLTGEHQFSFYINNELLLKIYHEYRTINIINTLVIGVTIVIIGIAVIQQLFNKLSLKLNAQVKFEALVKKILLFSSLITIAATLAIILSLLWEAILFFDQVPLFNYLFGKTWLPQDSAVDAKNSFSVLPLLVGTFLIAIIACIVALIFAVPAAIYMAEFMPKKIKYWVKPLLEILSGIPTIVYGFFAALTLGPTLTKLGAYFNMNLSSDSAIVAGIVIGMMIIPFISSATDDIMSAIPKSIREGAYALGSMPYEVVLKVFLPMAMPSIFSSFLLAFSRAIGETMIVVMASGLVANLTFNPLEPVTTITTQIVIIAQGDQDFTSIKTLSMFALGLTLFCVTLLLNLFSFWIIKRFQVKY